MKRFLQRARTRIVRWFRQPDAWSLGLVFFLIFLAFLINTFHEQYPDEFDNILGGWYILHGKLPYSGFFTHHGPVPYFLAAILGIFSGDSFVRFRIIYAIFLCLFSIGSYLYLQSRFKTISVQFYLYFIGLLAIAETYFWGHMLLADSLAAFLIVPVIALLLLKTVYKLPLFRSELWVISIISCLTLLTSLTYIYVLLMVYLYALYLYLRVLPRKKMLKNFLWFVLIMAVPYLVYLVYLLVTLSLFDYVYDSIIFNQKYYIYSPGGEPKTSNPIRFAIIIIHTFYGNFYTLLQEAKDFNFGTPFTITLAIANVSMLTYLLSKRKFSAAIFYFLVIAFANARTNPLLSKETDYQSAVYIVISLLAVCFVLYQLWFELQREVFFGKKVLYGFLFIFLGVYTIFCVGFLSNKFFDKAFLKYMGQQALIYDRPQVAPVINAITTKNDTAWVGPFAYQDLFYQKANIPSRYQVFLPEMSKSQRITMQMMQEFTANKPLVIYFDKYFYILGSNPVQYGQFFLNFLSDNYVTVAQYNQENGTNYRSVPAVTSDLDIETKLYMRKDKADEVIQRLLDTNLIKQM